MNGRFPTWLRAYVFINVAFVAHVEVLDHLLLSRRCQLRGNQLPVCAALVQCFCTARPITVSPFLPPFFCNWDAVKSFLPTPINSQHVFWVLAAMASRTCLYTNALNILLYFWLSPSFFPFSLCWQDNINFWRHMEPSGTNPGTKPFSDHTWTSQSVGTKWNQLEPTQEPSQIPLLARTHQILAPHGTKWNQPRNQAISLCRDPKTKLHTISLL